MKIALAILFAVSVAGSIPFTNYFMGSMGIQKELDVYHSLHSPGEGLYYSVDATKSIEGRTFIIGRVAKPMIGGTIQQEGPLIQIEVPTTKVGSEKFGAYLTVRKNKFGQMATIYFVGPENVVIDALQN